VTVAVAEGSCPREPGAKMLVTADGQSDTVGGGHLEMRACEIARAMLNDRDLPARQLQRFALGPSLGQCCGGVVHLAFERIDERMQACMKSLRLRARERQDSWRLVPLDDATPAVLLDREGRHDEDALPQPLPAVNIDLPCHLVRDNAGRRWLVDPILPHRPHLVLFGGGPALPHHLGRPAGRHVSADTAGQSANRGHRRAGSPCRQRARRLQLFGADP
jgi:xanthine dehydrogenase accessory factor